MSLKYRIAAVLFVLQASVLGVSIWQGISLTVEGSRQQLTAIDDARLAQVADLARTASVTEEYDDLMAHLRRLTLDPRILAAHVVGPDGRVIASSDPRLLGGAGPSLAPEPLRRWTTMPLVVASQTLGLIAVQVSDADLMATRTAAWRRAGLVGAAGLVLGALIALAFGHALTRPLERLLVATRRLAAGDASARAGLRGTDEIARLGGAFDEMAERLAALLAGERRARSAAETSEAGYRSLVQGSIQGICVHQAGGIRFANPALARIFGYSAPAELVGRRWDSLLTAEGAPPAGEPSPPRREVQGVRQDGTHIWIEGLESSVQWEGAPATLLTCVDVTERRQAEAALRESEEQLRQSQKMEALGQLAGGIAHDFNNMLTVIMGRSEVLLLKLPGEHPIRRDLETINGVARRAAALTRQLLAFGRRQLIEPAELDPAQTLRGLEPILRRLIEENIELVVEASPGVGAIRIDPGHLEQVVMNLSLNARDAMPQGGRLSIRLAETGPRQESGQEAGARRHVELTVTDTGLGMDAETRRRVFEPFFTTKERGRGTGLGLSIVYGIVIQNGGRIEVESEPGRGTTFRIGLPRVDGVAPREPVSRPAPTPRSTGTLLLVEDEDEVRRLIRESLESAGFTVIVAGTSAAALELAEAELAAVELLVTDVIMPGMSGPTLAARLAARRPGLQVLYISGYTDDAIQQHVAPDVTLLAKPFTPTELVDRVRAVMSGQA